MPVNEVDFEEHVDRFYSQLVPQEVNSYQCKLVPQ